MLAVQDGMQHCCSCKFLDLGVLYLFSYTSTFGEHYRNILEVDEIRSNQMSVRTLITITSTQMIQVTPPEVRP